ncbi:MAG: hypothetical protein ACRCXX_08695 [Cetobacterium sp.]|uniref:hypothetical protein n=1 Tax=Cetobacterium sp. TaxID=2071632 RepID=UPI003F3EDA38
MMTDFVKFMIKFATYTLKYNLLFKVFFKLKPTTGAVVLLEILYVIIITMVYFNDLAKLVGDFIKQ